MVMLIAACGSSSPKGGPKPKTGTTSVNTKLTNVKPDLGGKVTFALQAETTGGWCLPEAQLAISGIQVTRAIYDYLAVPNDKNEYVPELADKNTSNPDFTSWTIHVRAGIKVQDGTT